MLLKLPLILGLLGEIIVLNHLKSCVIFCCSPRNCIKITEFLQNEKVSTSTFNLNTLHDLSIVEQTFYHTSSRIGVIIDLDCNESATNLYEMSQKNKFNESFVWFAYTTSRENIKILSELNIQWDSEVFLAVGDSEKGIAVYEVFKFKRDTAYPLTMNFVGSWNGKIFNISKDFFGIAKTERRLNFQGSEIYGAVSIINIKPGYSVLDMLQKRVDSTTAGSAFQYSLLKTIVDRINATLVIRRVSTWSQFSRHPNESLTGTIGLLNSSLADISVTPLSMTSDRLNYATPTATTWNAQFGFVFRHPQTTSLRAVYLQPFTNIVWIATIIVLLLFWGALAIAIRYYPEHSSASAFLGIFGAFAQQGFSERLPSISGRILLGMGLIFSLLCYQFYATFIVASLITESPKNLRTVEDLAASKLIIGANPVPYNEHLFNSTSTTLSLIYANRVKKPGNFFLPPKGLQMIQNGGFAYHFDLETMYEKIVATFSEGEICDLQEITSWKVLQSSAVVGKNSPYRDLINVLTRRLIEGGIVQHERTKWFTMRPKCFTSRIVVQPVEIEQILTPLAIIFGGIVMSLLVLVGEIFHKNIHLQKAPKNGTK